MSRYLLSLVLISACGDDPTPHDIVDCVSDWTEPNAPTVRCQRACATKSDEQGPSCTNERGATCTVTFAFEDARGCCFTDPIPEPAEVLFLECTD